MKVQIDKISHTKQHRKDVGDLDGLKASIEDIGLLHPIVLLPDFTLVAGRRRLEAARQLGWKTIEANVAGSLEPLQKYLRAQCDENTCRKPFAPVEAVALGKAIEKEAAKLAKAEQAKGMSADGKAGGRGRKRNLGANCPKVSGRDESTRATAIAAAAVGMKRRTYEKAKAVVESQNTEAQEKLKETGKVDAAHKILAGTTPGRPKSKTVQMTTLDGIKETLDDLWRLLDKPTLEVSWFDVRKRAHEARQAVTKLTQ